MVWYGMVWDRVVDLLVARTATGIGMSTGTCLALAYLVYGQTDRQYLILNSLLTDGCLFISFLLFDRCKRWGVQNGMNNDLFVCSLLFSPLRFCSSYVDGWMKSG